MHIPRTAAITIANLATRTQSSGWSAAGNIQHATARVQRTLSAWHEMHTKHHAA